MGFHLQVLFWYCQRFGSSPPGAGEAHCACNLKSNNILIDTEFLPQLFGFQLAPYLEFCSGSGHTWSLGSGLQGLWASQDAKCQQSEWHLQFEIDPIGDAHTKVSHWQHHLLAIQGFPPAVLKHKVSNIFNSELLNHSIDQNSTNEQGLVVVPNWQLLATLLNILWGWISSVSSCISMLPVVASGCQPILGATTSKMSKSLDRLKQRWPCFTSRSFVAGSRWQKKWSPLSTLHCDFRRAEQVSDWSSNHQWDLG